MKKEGNKSTNVMDLFFSGWSNNYHYGWLEEVENRSLQAISSQKEWIQTARGQLTELENSSKQMTTDWKTSVQELLMNYQPQIGNFDWVDTLNKVEEFGHMTQTIAFTPGKATMEILSNSHDQFEVGYKNALDQHQKNRKEFTKVVEGIFEQFNQNGVLKSFGLAAK